MLLFRWAMMFLLLVAGVSFAFYIGTGKAYFRQWGMIILSILMGCFTTAFARRRR